MKGISGIIGGVVLILVLIVVVSLVLVSLRYLYGVQQLEMRQAISEVSQPHIVQISPLSVESSGELVATYAIYPDGKVEKIDQAVSGFHNFQSLLNGDPWAIIVFSNGQWVNVSNTWNIGYSGFGILGTGSYLVPYYPGSIDPSDYTQLASIIYNGIKYNTPLYYLVNATFYSYTVTAHIDTRFPPFISITTSYENASVVVNPSDPLVFSTGRILEVPVTSEDGWLNFTAVSLNGGPISFAVLIPNTSGTMVALYVSYSTYQATYDELFGLGNNTFLYEQRSQTSGSLTYGIYQFINNPVSQVPSGYLAVFPTIPGTPLVLNPNISYTFHNTSTQGTTVIKVALKFSPGQPAQMYLWAGYYNGSGISWQRIFLPSIDVPTGFAIGYASPIVKQYTYSSYNSLGQHYVSPWEYTCIVGYNPPSWQGTKPSWPVNIYSEYARGGGLAGYLVYAEPLDPELGSDILVIPSTSYPSYQLSGTAIVNVAYSI